MKRLQLLDYGRFFAAVYVILFHYTFNGIQNGKISSISHVEGLIDFTKYGYLGVEFFFMISGYVIFFSARNRTASQFATSRALRLYPLFWFAVLFTTLFAFFWGGSAMSVSPVKAIINLTMVPNLLGIGYVDGVYWTLFLELQFYFLVFALILFGFQRKLNTMFLVWPFIMALALFAGIGNWPFLGGYYSFFAAGAILAMAKDKLSLKTGIPLLIAYALCVNFSVDHALLLSKGKGTELSGLVVALIISIFFVFFLVMNSKRGSQLQLPKSSLVGALTYPIYLIHAHFGYMFISRFGTEQNKLFIYVLTFAIVLSVAYFMHTVVEVRFNAAWKSLFKNLVGKPVDKLQRQLYNLRSSEEEQVKSI